MTGWFYMSNKTATFAVEVLCDVVVKAPPIAMRFVGRPLDELIAWMKPDRTEWMVGREKM